MEAMEVLEAVCRERTFVNVSQRVVSSYVKALSEFEYFPSAAGETPLGAGAEESRAALFAFFVSLYIHLFERPASFGLPLREDISIAEEETERKEKKQEVKRHLDKARRLLQSGLCFLMQAGIHGLPEGRDLRLEGYPSRVERTKVSRKFLGGLEEVGLVISVDGDTARMHATRYPQMMPALKELAAACAGYEDANIGNFQFARCDFMALQQAGPCVPDLYRMLRGEYYPQVMALHAYFSDKGYTTACQVHGAHRWVVQYQGDRKVKATPLFQVEYDERHARPLRMQIKCASANRLAGVLLSQPQPLQDDFFGRANACRGAKCGWCRNKKSLGPSTIPYRGGTRTVCWYTCPEVHEISGDTVELIKLYEQMHAGLVETK